MAHAVANATNWTAKTREHLRKVLTQCNCEYHFTAVQLHNAIIVLRVSSTIAWVNIFLGCWRDSPFLNRTHLVFAEIIPMGGQEAPRPDSDEDCIRIGSFCYSHYAERLARLKQVSNFERSWYDRGEIRTMPNYDLPSTRQEASALTHGFSTWGTCTAGDPFAYLKGYIYCTAATN